MDETKNGTADGNWSTETLAKSTHSGTAKRHEQPQYKSNTREQCNSLEISSLNSTFFSLFPSLSTCFQLLEFIFPFFFPCLISLLYTKRCFFSSRVQTTFQLLYFEGKKKNEERKRKLSIQILCTVKLALYRTRDFPCEYAPLFFSAFFSLWLIERERERARTTISLSIAHSVSAHTILSFISCYSHHTDVWHSFLSCATEYFLSLSLARGLSSAVSRCFNGTNTLARI